MPEERIELEPIGLGLQGHWIELKDTVTPQDMERFATSRRLDPAMGAGGGPVSSPYAPPMLIVERRSGATVGMIENHGLPGGVAVVVVYLDRARGRAGYGVEALALYVSHLFDSGARHVTGEVLAFNTAMVRVMHHMTLPPRARMREHVFAAGRFWDLLVYSFDREQWLSGLGRYRRFLPGGDRSPTVLGGRRRDKSAG